MGADIPACIRDFGGRGKIHFVHFRDVRGRADSFVETFHDDGQTDMFAAMAAYRQVGYEGPLRPDHAPSMEGEKAHRPGYGVMGRLFAIGYMRGLIEGVDALTRVASRT
jgi:mannonate dehydratase